MPANINTYIGRESAWHALGTVTGRYQTTEDLLNDKGFQYTVFKSQLHDGLGRKVNAWATFRWDLADKNAGLKDKATFLGVVGEDYKVIQHQEGFQTIDALMRTADGAHYETAGVLGDGERVWALADLGLTARIGDDVQQGYLLFSTGHDGSLAHSYRICMTRVVCQNTLSAALREKSRASLTIRHTKNAMGRLNNAREALDNIADDVRSMEDKLNFLASRKMTRDAVVTIMDRLFPKTKKEQSDDTVIEESSTRRENILADVLKLYEMNDGNAYPEQRGTAYSLLNAITNYTDHDRSSKGNGTGRAESAMFGSGDRFKTQAMQVIMETADGLPVMQQRTVLTPGPTSNDTSYGANLDAILAEHAS